MFLLDLSRLNSARADLSRADQRLQKLVEQAKQIKARPFLTVMDKAQDSPSGDKHDYLSFGPYWWPNPNAPDGLPYLRRDGLLNPETAQSDKTALEALMREVETLALAYFYTSDETFARAAAERLRAWFVDPRTRMNPHLEYGQAIPGVCAGRGIGIIDTVELRLLPDVVQMLRPSEFWAAQDAAALRQWMSEYLEWLLTSAHGQREAGEHNNHGTWYDVQVALLALVTGGAAVAQKVLENVPAKTPGAPHCARRRAAARIGAHALVSYSCYNLKALFDLARLAQQLGLDLWNWRGEGGASLQRALEFLAPYSDPKTVWPYPQVVPDDRSQLLELDCCAGAPLTFPINTGHPRWKMPNKHLPKPRNCNCCGRFSRGQAKKFNGRRNSPQNQKSEVD